jgi:hypothetical protein
MITGKKRRVKAKKGEIKTMIFKSKPRKKRYGKVHPVTCHGGIMGEYKYPFILSLNSVLRGSGWLTPDPGRLNFENDQLPTV